MCCLIGIGAGGNIDIICTNNAKYKAITDREQKRDEDVLCYQIWQSFLPCEVDTETALKIGYDVGMGWRKGKHAYFVVSQRYFVVSSIFT